MNRARNSFAPLTMPGVPTKDDGCYIDHCQVRERQHVEAITKLSHLLVHFCIPYVLLKGDNELV